MTRVIKRWNNLDQFTFLSPHHHHRQQREKPPLSPLLSSPLLPSSLSNSDNNGDHVRPSPRTSVVPPQVIHPDPSFGDEVPRTYSSAPHSPATIHHGYLRYHGTPPPAPRIEPSRSLHRHTPVAFGFAPHLRRRLLSSRGHPFVRPGCIGVSSEPSSQAASKPTSQAPDSSVERSSPNKPSRQFTFIGREHGKR